MKQPKMMRSIFFPTPEEIEAARAPTVGMTFTSVKEAQRFVNVYGQLKGFSVIKGRNYKQRKITLQCNRSRKQKEVNAQRKRKRYTIERTDCAMKVRVTLRDGRWEITTVQNEHNHDLVSTPSLTKFFLKHRYMSESEKNLSRILQESRIKPRKIMAIFRKMSGSFKLMNFSKVDVNNLKQSDRRKRIKNTDMDRAIEFVKKIQLEDPRFYYTHRKEEDNTVRSLFWTDATSRMNYALYGDFISFDTTYSTNKYNMPFAPIVGINGHGKNIVFGWALLEDQKSETFSWLLETFVEVMGGKKPGLIMTDQDAAMKKAISELFPSEVHRNCFWHVMRNARQHLGAFLEVRQGMEKEMDKLIYDSLTEVEFEEGWATMIEKYKASGNSYLNQMYNTRKMWVPVFLKKVFCPFIWTTGRSESTNSNFKDFVMRKDSIETFLQQYVIFQEEQESIENKDRFESNVLISKYSTMKPIERQAGDIYTRGIYGKFQKELLFSDAFSVEEIEKDKKYILNKLMSYKEEEFHRDSFVIQVDREESNFECVCAKYDRDGILCCHVLRLFTQLGINEIPAKYIKDRWTQKWKEEVLKKQKQIQLEKGSDGKGQSAIRYAMMMTKTADICAALSKDPEKSNKFLEELYKIEEKIHNEAIVDKQLESAGSTSIYKDPPIAVAKSVRKGNRLLWQAEKPKAKKKAAIKKSAATEEGIENGNE
uniref:Protein FAR1-RELATED SEQUENCE n=1 Tax=Arundo donax TaxID=35708 RepID=A0A0A9T3X6_ARUDO